MFHLRKKILAWLEGRKRDLEKIQERELLKHIKKEQEKLIIEKIIKDQKNE